MRSIDEPMHNAMWNQADMSLRGKFMRRASQFVVRRPVPADAGRPIVTICFDDVPRSALQGAEILQERGLRGVFYVAGALVEGGNDDHLSAGEVGALAAAGHEVGGHTWAHRSVATDPDLLPGVRRNSEAIERWTGARPRTFAYPFGDVSPAAKALLAPRFTTLRSVRPGIIRRGTDAAQLPAVPIDDGAGAWIERVGSGGWLVLFTHDVDERPTPFGCRPETLRRVVDRALAVGCQVSTMSEAAQAVGL